MAGEESGLAYFARWEVPICALIVLVPAVVAIVVILKTKECRRRLLDVRTWLPCWRGLHPAWLLSYRALAFLIMAVVFSQVLRYEGVHAFFFYTQWTFGLVAVYFGVGTLVSGQKCWSFSKEEPSAIEERNMFFNCDLEESRAVDNQERSNTGITSLKSHDGEEKANILGNLLQVMYQICAGAVLLTDIVFWCLIVPFLTDNHFKLNVLMGLLHSMNFVSLLFDTALNSMEFPLFGMAYFVLWSCAFVTFQWILHACGVSWWPYPFLRLDTPWAPLWYLGIALVHLPCYCFYFLVVKLKSSLLSMYFPDAIVQIRKMQNH